MPPNSPRPQIFGDAQEGGGVGEDGVGCPINAVPGISNPSLMSIMLLICPNALFAKPKD